MKPFAPFAVLSLSVFATTIAGATLSRTGAPSVVFTASGPAGLKIEGKTNELDVKEEGNGTLTMTVPLGGLDTGIALRNKHMREKYLETGKYPTAQLVVTRTSLSLPNEDGSASGAATGQVTIHGQTRPATVNYTTKRSGSSYDVQGSIHVNINDFGISVPSYLGVTVKPDIDIVVKFTANDA